MSRSEHLEHVSIETGGVSYHLQLLNLENATLAFFYEGSWKLGTVASAIPGKGEMMTASSSVLLGGKYIVISRALAELVASLFGKMAMVSVYSTLDETAAFRIFAGLASQLKAKLSVESSNRNQPQ